MPPSQHAAARNNATAACVLPLVWAPHADVEAARRAVLSTLPPPPVPPVCVPPPLDRTEDAQAWASSSTEFAAAFQEYAFAVRVWSAHRRDRLEQAFVALNPGALNALTDVVLDELAQQQQHPPQGRLVYAQGAVAVAAAAVAAAAEAVAQRSHGSSLSAFPQRVKHARKKQKHKQARHITEISAPQLLKRVVMYVGRLVDWAYGPDGVLQSALLGVGPCGTGPHGTGTHGTGVHGTDTACDARTWIHAYDRARARASADPPVKPRATLPRVWAARKRVQQAASAAAHPKLPPPPVWVPVGDPATHPATASEDCAAVGAAPFAVAQAAHVRAARHAGKQHAAAAMDAFLALNPVQARALQDAVLRELLECLRTDAHAAALAAAPVEDVAAFMQDVAAAAHAEAAEVVAWAYRRDGTREPSLLQDADAASDGNNDDALAWVYAHARWRTQVAAFTTPRPHRTGVPLLPRVWAPCEQVVAMRHAALRVCGPPPSPPRWEHAHVQGIGARFARACVGAAFAEQQEQYAYAARAWGRRVDAMSACLFRRLNEPALQELALVLGGMHGPHHNANDVVDAAAKVALLDASALVAWAYGPDGTLQTRLLGRGAGAAAHGLGDEAAAQDDDNDDSPAHVLAWVQAHVRFLSEVRDGQDPQLAARALEAEAYEAAVVACAQQRYECADGVNSLAGLKASIQAAADDPASDAGANAREFMALTLAGGGALAWVPWPVPATEWGPGTPVRLQRPPRVVASSTGHLPWHAELCARTLLAAALAYAAFMRAHMRCVRLTACCTHTAHPARVNYHPPRPAAAEGDSSSSSGRGSSGRGSSNGSSSSSSHPLTLPAAWHAHMQAAAQLHLWMPRLLACCYRGRIVSALRVLEDLSAGAVPLCPAVDALVAALAAAPPGKVTHALPCVLASLQAAAVRVMALVATARLLWQQYCDAAAGDVRAELAWLSAQGTCDDLMPNPCTFEAAVVRAVDTAEGRCVDAVAGTVPGTGGAAAAPSSTAAPSRTAAPSSPDVLQLDVLTKLKAMHRIVVCTRTIAQIVHNTTSTDYTHTPDNVALFLQGAGISIPQAQTAMPSLSLMALHIASTDAWDAINTRQDLTPLNEQMTAAQGSQVAQLVLAPGVVTLAAFHALEAWTPPSWLLPDVPEPPQTFAKAPPTQAETRAAGPETPLSAAVPPRQTRSGRKHR